MGCASYGPGALRGRLAADTYLLMVDALRRGPKGGWAGVVGRPDRVVRRFLARGLPGLVATAAVAGAVWFVWPRSVEPSAPAEPSAPPAVAAPDPSTRSTTSTRARPAQNPRPPRTPRTSDSTTGSGRIDRAAVAAFASGGNGGPPVPLFAPNAIPAGWRLDGAEVVPAAQTPELCDQVGVYWTDAADARRGILDTYQFPTVCAKPQPAGAEAFRVAGATGWIVRDAASGLWHGQLVVGATAIDLWSDLAPADLARLFGARMPLDLDRVPPDSFRPGS